MNIYKFADIIGKDIIITRYANQNRFSARFDNCEIKDGHCLISTCGNGTTPEEALFNYAAEIKGKKLVFNAMSKEYRQEFIFPKDSQNE